MKTFVYCVIGTFVVIFMLNTQFWWNKYNLFNQEVEKCQEKLPRNMVCKYKSMNFEIQEKK